MLNSKNSNHNNNNNNDNNNHYIYIYITNQGLLESTSNQILTKSTVLEYIYIHIWPEIYVIINENTNKLKDQLVNNINLITPSQEKSSISIWRLIIKLLYIYI